MTSATSLAVPNRASGVPNSAARFQAGVWVMGAVSGVSIMPGATQLARIAGASSSAALAVNAITPAFTAEYGPSPRVGRRPVSDAFVTMLPPPPSTMIWPAARIVLNVPVRFTPTSSANSLSVYSSSGFAVPVPALVTRSVSPPMRLAASCTALVTPSASRTSTSKAIPPTSFATSLAPSPLRSITATAAPSCAKRRQVSAPMPDAPAVMTARRPSSAPTSVPACRVADHRHDVLGEEDLQLVRVEEVRLVLPHELGLRLGQHGEELVPRREHLHGHAIEVGPGLRTRQRAVLLVADEVAGERGRVTDERAVSIAPVAEELLVGEPGLADEERVQGHAHSGSSLTTPLSDTFAVHALPSHQRYWWRPTWSGCHAAGLPPAAAAAEAAVTISTGSAAGGPTVIFPFEKAVPGVFQLTRMPSGG